jgi:chorismate-pyruvate lyase
MTSLFTEILDENGNSHEIKNKAKFQFRSSRVTVSPVEIMEITEWFKIQTSRYAYKLLG